MILLEHTMTDVEMNITPKNKEDNTIANIQNAYNNDTATMGTEDRDPLAFDDDEDQKMEVDDEPNAKTTDLNIQKDVIKETVEIANIIKNSTEIIKTNTNSETDAQNSNEIIEKDEVLQNNGDILKESNGVDDKIVAKISPTILTTESQEVVKNNEYLNETDSKEVICEENGIVLSKEKSETINEKETNRIEDKNELPNEKDDDVASTQNEKASVDIECVNKENNCNEINNDNTVKCNVIDDSKPSPKNESQCSSGETVSVNISKDDAKPVESEIENTATDIKLNITKTHIENSQTQNGIEPISASSTIDRPNKERDKLLPVMLSQREDPLKSLKNIINRHTADVVIKREDISCDFEAKDLENELPASIVSIKNESIFNKQDDGRSSGESDSDEQTLHIADENATQLPALNTNNSLCKKNGSNKSKRRNSETEKSKSQENPTKKLCRELEETFEQHDAMIVDYIANTSNSSVEEIDKHTETLVTEIETLKDLAQTKENEWNNILHLKKVKEEILLRLIRKKKIILLERVNHDINECKKSLANRNFMNISQNVIHDKFDDIPSSKSPLNNINKSLSINSSAMSMPISSSPFCPITMPNYSLPLDKNIHYYGNKKIVPKPLNTMPNRSLYDKNGQIESFMMPMGRQGPTKDVQSIIADYRNKHPETAPRRGRRLRGIVNPQSPQMAMGPRPIAPHPSDHPMDLGMFLGRMENNPNLSISESFAAQHNPMLQQIPTSLPNGMSFKDVLVQFANMSGTGSINNNGIGANLPPPPPYPEVTLHPVGNSMSGVKVTPIPQSQMLSASSQQSQHLAQLAASQQTNSLLHGILTKQQPKQADSRFSAFSPTLARLLTTPEKSNSGTSTSAPSGYMPQKNCMEITITPVPQSTQNSRIESDVVQLDDFEDPELEEDSAERPLVIDEEGADKESGAVELNESEVPECQGCHRKEAQFVCAGCANQWYCSRECQVTAWDEHSEMCSG